MPPASDLPPGTQAAQLRRVLTLWDLVFYGIVLIQPIAAVPLFGIADVLSRGHVVTTILVAMVAMMLTARSYGRMAAVYPTSGSAYTYVGRELNPHLGFLTGWAMLLDYLAIPLINIIYGALTLARLFPAVPYVVWATIIGVIITYCNMRGVRTTARANLTLLVMMCCVIGIFIALAVRFLFIHQGIGGLLSWQPIYSPGASNFSAIATAIPLAALTYIGFDGISTLSEEVKNPKKNILRATVLVCLFTGLFSGLQVYLAQRVWPDYRSFPHIETAFMDVAHRVGGQPLFDGMAFILVLASIGSGLTGQAGAARLLFGMGRDNALPAKIFGHLDPEYGVPSYNLYLIGITAFAGSLLLTYEMAAEIINFGAFCAFMGVNLAAMKRFYFSRRRDPGRRIADLLLPGAGFVFCFWIFWNLPGPAKLVGSAWLAGAIVFDGIKTRGFRSAPASIDFNTE